MFYRSANLPSQHERKTYDVPLETENQPADAVNTERGREKEGERELRKRERDREGQRENRKSETVSSQNYLPYRELRRRRICGFWLAGF